MRQSAASKRDSSGGGGLLVLSLGAAAAAWSIAGSGRGRLFGGGIAAVV